MVEDNLLEQSTSRDYYAFKLKDFAPADALALAHPNTDLEKEVVLLYKNIVEQSQEAKMLHDGQTAL